MPPKRQRAKSSAAVKPEIGPTQQEVDAEAKEPSVYVPANKEPGTPEWMLEKLASEGENCASDYDDGVNGWFGWRVDNTGRWGTIIVQWTPDGEGGSGPTTEARWRLVPVPEGKV